jgi:glutaryl-CoA dehydrogenase
MVFKNVDYYDIGEQFSDEEKIIRDSVRAFLETKVEPLIINAFDQEEPIDMKILAPEMGKLSMIGAFIPEEYGGPGASYVDFGLICQEMERIDSALRSFMAVQSIGISDVSHMAVWL